MNQTLLLKSLLKTINLTTWEEAVDDVETVERNSKDRKVDTEQDTLLLLPNLMCPQKIIRFYEEHLKFKDLDED
ncbi:unnamed protein product [Rhizophagus irregularis]|nr:unnamed protein product [Rhizophagus irregularis]